MNKITLYSKPDCPWCDKAKQLLNELGFEYTELVLGEHYTKDDLKAKLPFVARLTVPQVFVDGDHIGGYEDLKAFVELNKGIDSMLRKKTDG